MTFIKRGDDIKNKIIAVINEDDLSEEQKKSSSKLLKKSYNKDKEEKSE